MRDSAIAIEGRGPGLSYSFALLEPTFSGFDKIFRTLDTQEVAVRQLFANGATTFDALSRRRGELRSLIASSNKVLQTTAQPRSGPDRDLPGLPDVPRRVAADARAPAVVLARRRPAGPQLIPVASELSPTLVDIGRLAPECRASSTASAR